MTPQHLEALASANRIRLGIADVKNDLDAGTLSVAQALRDERAASMRIGDLLAAQHRWGMTRSQRVLRAAQVGERRRVRDLTARQRTAIVANLAPLLEAPAVRIVLPPPGMEPERVDARVVVALLKGPVTRVELALRLRGMQLAVDDLDASLARLWTRRAVVCRVADGFELYDIGPVTGRSPTPTRRTRHEPHRTT